MFERYTEAARRALFFARYETSQLGGRTITTEHILLGLLRAPSELVDDMFAACNISVLDLRSQLEAHARDGATLTTSAEVPFDEATKRVLHFAVEEADLLPQRDIGPEHLLLGLLREDHSFAANALNATGISVKTARSQIEAQATAQEAPREADEGSTARDAAARSLASTHIQRLAGLVSDLAKAEPNSVDSGALLVRIHTELMMLQQMLE